MFTPSFGVDAVASNASVADVLTITAKSTINTDTGAVLDSNGVTLAIPTTVVSQTDAPSIRVLYAKQLLIEDVVVTGNLPIAFVTSGELVVMGKIEAGAKSSTQGPGGVSAGPMVGLIGSDTVNFISYSGGGGNGEAALPPYGGAMYALETLVGGGAGGNFDPPVNGSAPGGGGGAVQLVSYESLTIQGGINVGGGGGTKGLGGGAGGTIVIESPRISIDGILAANGGAGDACDNGEDPTKNTANMDGQYSNAPSQPAHCTFLSTGMLWSGGAGGTGTTAPTLGHGPMTPFPTPGGDGGAVGRLVIRTSDGTYMKTNTTIESAVTTTDIAVH